MAKLSRESLMTLEAYAKARKDFRAKDKLDVSLEVSTYSKEPPAKTDTEAADGSAKKGT